MKRLSLFLLLTITLLGCRKSPIEWDSSLNIPIIQTQLSFAHLFPDSILSADEDHQLSLIIDKELFALSTNNLTTFPDSIFQLELSVPSAVSLSPNALIFRKNELQKLQLSPLELTKIALHGGFIAFEVINPFDQPIELEYQIPAATLYGVPLSKKITIPKASANNQNYTARVDLSNYKLDLRGPDFNTFNSYQNILTVRVSPQAPDSAHTLGNQLLIKIHFEDMDLGYAKGFLGKQHINYGPEKSNFSFFEKIEDGTLNLEKSKTLFTISNGIGADLQFQLNHLVAMNSKNGTETTFQSSIIQQIINITRASETNNSANPVIPFKTTIDISNSNILELLSTFPDAIEYQATIHLNPLGNISAGNDFVYRLHNFATRLYMEIPFSFSASNLTLRETLPYSMSDELQNVNSIKLNLIVDNSFPFSATIKLDIMDNQDNIISSIFQNNNTISSALLVEEGVTTAVRSILPVTLNEQQIKQLKKNQKLQITAIFNTNGENYTKIYENYQMKIKLVGIVDYHFEIE